VERIERKSAQRAFLDTFFDHRKSIKQIVLKFALARNSIYDLNSAGLKTTFSNFTV